MQSRLLVPNCPHASHALFSAHYLRSNRTRAPKVLRCFPHCCPGHRARSYCGAPIHVEVSQPDSASRAPPIGRQDQAGDVPELLVYGHFERENGDDEPATDLVAGQHVWLQDVLTDESSWVRGLATTATMASSSSRTRNPRTRVFKFNDDEYCHWLYDWNSGTSQRERARQHFFRAYVFKRVDYSSSVHSVASRPASATSLVDDASAAFQWQVVSAVSSPGFTISAFRKEASTPSAGDAAVSVGATSPPPVVLPSRGIPQRLELDRQPQQTAGSTTGSHAHTHHRQQQATDPPNQQEASFLAEWTRANPEAVEKSTQLALAALVLSQLDINWLDPAYFASSLFELLRQWPVQGVKPPERQHREDALWHFVTYVAPKLLSLYGASISCVSSQSASPPTAGLQQAADLAEVGFSLFCHLVDDAQWGSTRDVLLRDVVDSLHLDQTALEDCERVANAVATFHDVLERQMSAWLVQRGLSLESFVDDLVSCVFVDRTQLELFPAALDRHVLALLRNDTFLGLELMDGQFHELQRAAAQHLPRDRRRQFLRSRGAEQDMTAGTRQCRVNGEWACRAVDVDQVDPRAWMEAQSRVQREPNARVRLGMALASLLLSAGFHMELKDVGSSFSTRRRRQHRWSGHRGPHGDGSGDDEEEKEDADADDDASRPTRSHLEISALTSLFPDVCARLELDGDLRSLPALANGLTPAWLGALSFPLDDGVVDYSAYLTAPASGPVSSSSGPRSRRQGTGEDEELFLSFFYYADDGSAYRLRMGFSADLPKPNARPWNSSDGHLDVFVQVAVGSVDPRSPGAIPDGVDWNRSSPRERHALIQAWASLASFHLHYDRVSSAGRADEDGYPMADEDDSDRGPAHFAPPAPFPKRSRSSGRSQREDMAAFV